MKPIIDQDLASLLDQTLWTKDMPWSEVQILSRYFRLYHAGQDEWLFREGDPPEFMGLLLKGRLEILKTCAQSHDIKRIAEVRPQQSFGEMAMIDNQVRSASARVTQPAIFLLTSQKQLFALAEQHPKLAFKFLWQLTHLISQRLRSASLQLTGL